MATHDHGSQPPEEPKTPMWLPALGAVLFLAVGLWWASRPADPSDTAPAPAAEPAPPAEPAKAVDPHAGHGH